MVQSIADFCQYYDQHGYCKIYLSEETSHTYNKIINYCAIMFCIFKILQFSNKKVSPFFELQTLEISPVYIPIYLH